MFWPLKFLGGEPPEILDRHYNRGKFYANRSTRLGDLALKKTSRVKLKSPENYRFKRLKVW